MTRLSAIPGLPPLIAALGLLALWEFAARVFDISGLPPAHAALRELPAILSDPEALLNILASIRRMLIGFTLALAFAIPVGLMMGRSRLTAAFFNPLLMIIYPVPKAALMPIIMLWLGVGDASKTLVIFLGVSLPVIYHSYQGARAVEEKMLCRPPRWAWAHARVCCASCSPPRCQRSSSASAPGWCSRSLPW